MQLLAEKHIRWGFNKMLYKLKQEGFTWNHKSIYRIYCELKLNIRVKPKKRIPARKAKTLKSPIKPNTCWSIDFMSDILSNTQKFRTLNDRTFEQTQSLDVILQYFFYDFDGNMIEINREPSDD